MKQILKNLYHNTSLGKIVIQHGIDLYNFYWTHLVADKHFLQKKFKDAFGRNIDFDDPKTLNEKINWLKLYDRTPLHTICADKFAVREYIEKKIGETYLVPLYFETTKSKEIIPENLPDIPCIIKTNHDSGGGIFVYDKNSINYNEAQKALQKRLKKNYYRTSKEWQYKNIKPCIIVEQLLQDANGNIPLDYKLHCFNGKVRMIQVDIGRGTENHHRNWYNDQWEREPYKWSSPKGEGKYTDPSDEDVPKPLTLGKMISLSNMLAEPFDYVRVDWYDVDGKLYFGELTFHHDSGTKPILPEEWDLQLGSELKLAKPKS